MRPLHNIMIDSFKNPKIFLKGVLRHCAPLIRSDKLYIEWLWYLKFGKKLNLNNPQTFNEKLQWLKLYDRKPIYTTMVDKYAAKKYVADIIGEEHIIPTIGIWNSVEEIDWEKLPEQFVLKCTHDSNGNVICRNKATLNINDANDKLKKGLKRNYYYQNREWPYKNVSPRIIAEEFMSDESQKTSGLVDYKFYCFNGEPRVLYISSGLENHSTASISFVTLDWKFAPFRRTDFKPFKELPSKPSMFDEMVDISRTLSKNHSFLRVDLYQINNRVYFSELTFSPCSGMMPFEPEEWNYKLGEWVDIDINAAR